MQSKARPAPIAFGLVALVLSGVGCNLTPEAPVITTSAPTTTTVPLTPQESVDVFRSCLIDRGFSVPDLPLDGAGRPDLSTLANLLDAGTPDWQEALASCAAVLVGSGALDLGGVPELAEAITADLLAFSTCMRSQGVEGFPDPAPGFDGNGPPFPLESIPADDPQFGAAAEVCAQAVGEVPA